MSELIRVGADGSLGFGDYSLAEKTKLSDFEFQGNIYKVKTFSGFTKLEKNECFLYESEPGTSVEGLKVVGEKVEFCVEGDGETQITLGLEDDTKYKVTVEGTVLGEMITNMGGKLVIAVDLEKGQSKKIDIERM